MFFDSNLRKLYTDRNLTQSELGKILGVSRQTISGYVRGDRQPDFDVLVQIANYFNISIDDLLQKDLQLENDKVATLVAETSHYIINNKYTANQIHITNNSHEQMLQEVQEYAGHASSEELLQILAFINYLKQKKSI